ncbi:MAG: hypothetical protein ACR2NH_05715 [Solirubrobacteraceae bacterium]
MTVHVNGATALTDAQGAAQLQTPAAAYRVYVCKKGLVGSFPERVVVR